MNRKWAACLAAVTLAFVAQVHAQAYPDKPIRMIIPLPPGGGTDTLGRFIAERLSAKLGQPVVPENKPGAGAVIGTDAVAKAKPDGYTILWTSSDGVSMAPVLKKSLPYKVPDDFTYVARVSDFAYIVTVTPKLPIKTMQELVAYAKAHPGELKYGTSGIGSGPHMATELIASATGTQMLHVPYQGIAPAIQAALGGHLDVILAAPTVKSQTDAGALRPLATTGATRNPDFPNLPTLAEAGIPNLVVTIWWGIMAPAGTPEPALARLRTAVAEILKDPVTIEGMRKLGYAPNYLPHDQFRAFVLEDMQQWGRAAKAANITLTD
ncbi:MAG: tripartite tricarboxylate transporter substrate binding protein [Burkholderiales bacterium]